MGEEGEHLLSERPPPPDGSRKGRRGEGATLSNDFSHEMRMILVCSAAAPHLLRSHGKEEGGLACFHQMTRLRRTGRSICFPPRRQPFPKRVRFANDNKLGCFFAQEKTLSFSLAYSKHINHVFSFKMLIQPIVFLAVQWRNCLPVGERVLLPSFPFTISLHRRSRL